MLHRSGQGEVLTEGIFPVHAEHGLALHAEVGVVLQAHVHARSGIDDALVQDGHLAGGIVHRVVATLLQGHASGSNNHRTLRHVVGTERYDVGTCSLELSGHDELVLLGILLGIRLGGVVERIEAVLVGQLLHSFRLQIVAQIVAERLSRWQEHAAIAHGVALHEVELSVGMGLQVAVQPVQSHHSQQRTALQLFLGQISQVGACSVALVLDVELEILLFHVRGQIVHVLHHQPPVALCGTTLCVLQCLHEEHLVGLRLVAGELTHLIGLSVVSIFEGYGQHLVGL